MMGAAAALALGVFTIAAPFIELVRELAVPLLAPVMVVIVQFAHLLATPLVVIMVVVHPTTHTTHALAHAALLTVITVLIVRTVLTGHAATGTAQAVAVPGALLAVTIGLLTHRRLAATKRTAALISAGIELAVLSLSACRRLMAHAMHPLLAAAVLATLITLLTTVLTALIALVSAVLAALMTLMAAILPTLETTLATVAARAV